MKTKLLFRGFLSLIALSVVLSPMNAGEIVGTVVDTSSRSLLPGATIVVVDTGESASADSAGRFRIQGLPGGEYRLRINHGRHETVTKTVTVPNSGSVSVTVEMDADVVQLESFVIEGYREGRSRALVQKRKSVNVIDIISADSIGNLPDRNVADAVARLPGVNIVRSPDGGVSDEESEGRYISIRGIGPAFNQVIIDGVNMAAPGAGGDRATPLDALSAGQIEQVEIIKSTTPDLDANALGGTVSIKSMSAFDREGRFVSGGVAANYNETAEKFNVESQLAFSDTFGAENTWGLAASVSYDERDTSNDWLQVNRWDLRNINGVDVLLPRDLRMKPASSSSRRYGLSFNLEYRPDDNTSFFVRPNFFHKDQFRNVNEILMFVNNSVGQVTMTSPTAGVFSGQTTSVERRESRALTENDVINVSTGLKKVVGSFTIEPMMAVSSAKEDQVYNRQLQTIAGSGTVGPVTFDVADLIPDWSLDPSIDVPSSYRLRRTRDDDRITDETLYTGKLDVRWDSDRILGHPGFLKAGVKYLDRDRTVDAESRRLVPVGDWTFADVGVLPGQPIYNGHYANSFLLDWNRTYDFIRNNPSLTVFNSEESAANSIESDYRMREKVYAGYAMGSITMDKLTLLGGVRWEATDGKLRSFENFFPPDGPEEVIPSEGSIDYSHVLPNLQAVYRFTDRLVARAAFTKTIGRPNYGDILPSASFRFDPIGASALDPGFPYRGSLEIGNPNLRPFEATNFDLSTEYYMKGDGVLAVALYHKRINGKHIEINEIRENVMHSGIALETLEVETSVNGGEDDSFTGLEFSLYQPFSFLPSPFNGFGVDLNMTFNRSKLTLEDRPGESLSLTDIPERFYNVTLFYERGKVSSRLAWSYTGQIATSYGGDPAEDRFIRARGQYDAQFRYRINDNYSIVSSISNITREPVQFIYTSTRMSQSELRDRTYRLGISFNY